MPTTTARSTRGRTAADAGERYRNSSPSAISGSMNENELSALGRTALHWPLANAALSIPCTRVNDRVARILPTEISRSEPTPAIVSRISSTPGARSATPTTPLKSRLPTNICTAAPRGHRIRLSDLRPQRSSPSRVDTAPLRRKPTGNGVESAVKARSCTLVAPLVFFARPSQA